MWRWFQRRRKNRKLYAFSTAPSAKWLSTPPPSSKLTTVVRNVEVLRVCTVFDTVFTVYNFIISQALNTRQCWRQEMVMEPSSPFRERESRPNWLHRLSCQLDSRTKLSTVRSVMCMSTLRLNSNRLVSVNVLSKTKLRQISCNTY